MFEQFGPFTIIAEQTEEWVVSPSVDQYWDIYLGLGGKEVDGKLYCAHRFKWKTVRTKSFVIREIAILKKVLEEFLDTNAHFCWKENSGNSQLHFVGNATSDQVM